MDESNKNENGNVQDEQKQQQQQQEKNSEKTFSETYVKELRHEAKTYRVQLDEANKQLETFKKENETLKTEKATFAQTQEKLNLKVELAGKVVDIDTALDLALKPEFKDDKGAFQVDKFKERYSYLFGEQKPQVKNNVETGKPLGNTLKPQDLAGKSIEEINKIYDEMYKKK